jgi:hypothetical protein
MRSTPVNRVPRTVRRAPRRRGRALVAALALLLLLAQPPATVNGDHGGREIGSVLACDRPVDPPRCTSVGNTRHHFVYFDPSLTDVLATAFRDTMTEDYEPTALQMYEQAELTEYTDVIVYSEDYGDSGAAGWVYCPPDAASGTNAQGHRWCRQQELHLNLNGRYAVYLADDASRDYVACHELGHTLGLRHWGNPPHSEGPAAATCMNADTPDGPTDLHQFDVDHINAYYAAPTPSRGFRGAHVASRESGSSIAMLGGGVHAVELERYHSLAALTRSADVVVHAEIVGLTAGRIFGAGSRDPLHYAAATLRVHELVAGALPARDSSDLTLEIPLFAGPESLPALRSSLVGSEGVFLLRDKGESARRAGLPPEAQVADTGFYRLVTLRALVTDDGGRARAATDEPGPLSELDGQRFDSAIQAIRAAADRAGDGIAAPEFANPAR